MKILLLGDGHTYGRGLSARQLSYTNHFIRQLSRTGRSVTVEAYAHLTLPQITALLAQLPLSHYDLIVLQLGPDLIQRKTTSRDSALPLPVAMPALPVLNLPVREGSPVSLRDRVKRVATVANALVNGAASVAPALGCPGGLAQLLTLLRPYRHTVLLMTPFPCRTVPEQWVRERSRSVLLETGTSQAFSVFDTGSVVQPRDEYFLTGDNEHLNAVSHELIGRALFDFYQSAPTIVTVHTTNRK